MKIVRSVVFVIACFSAAVAQAQNWVQISSSTDANVSIDPATIKRVSGSIRSAWFQFYNKSPKKNFDVMKEFDRVDCENESIATVSQLKYVSSGSLLNSRTIPSALLEYEPAPPGTLAATMLRVVCRFDLAQQ